MQVKIDEARHPIGHASSLITRQDIDGSGNVINEYRENPNNPMFFKLTKQAQFYGNDAVVVKTKTVNDFADDEEYDEEELPDEKSKVI